MLISGSRPAEALKSRQYGIGFRDDASNGGNGGERAVYDGPFGETNELVAGFWLLKVRDMPEAVEWVKRCPNPMPGPSEIEIRPLYEASDFGDALTPEIAEAEDRIRKKLSDV